MRLLYMAPQATLPPMDGADRRAWHLYEAMAQGGVSGAFLGRTLLVRSGETPQRHSPSRCWRDRKSLAALVALSSGADYWQLKHLLPGARKTAAQLASEPFDVVLVSILYAVPLARPFMDRGAKLVVDTHNYDPAWFGSLAAGSKNPVLRRLCQRAIANSMRTLATLPAGTTLVHVSEADARRYRPHRPDLEHVVVENGTSIRPRRVIPNYTSSARKRLVFVASLSAKMNQDALKYFATTFWPALRDQAEMVVAGSNPPPGVERLCSDLGWSLLANLTQEQLEAVYEQAHFAVLPFRYGEGSKLKFLEACGRGVPVLATTAGLCGVANPPALATVSDTPSDWAKRVRACSRPEPGDIQGLVAYAEPFSWPVLGRKLSGIIQDRLRSPATAILN